MGFSIGENVGPYRIVAQLGSGGMATVYKAYHAALDRYVAIKVMHAAFRQDPNFLARFQREARIVARLEHPHIVPVHDFSEHDGQPYLVMRFIEGDTLKARLQAGELTLEQSANLLRPVCQALAYAHEQGVLHRDIKPSNILITEQGGVFLTDFGLARIAQAGESTLSQDVMLGTPQYISPEQAMGRANLDARTDIYSLGVVMYELLVGRVPFQADTPYAIVHDHIYAPLPMPRSLKPELPAPFERVLLKALSKEPDDRFTTAADLLAALDKAVADLKTAAPAPVAPAATAPAAAAHKPSQASHRNVWIALGALLLIGAIVAIAYFGPSRQHLLRARWLRSRGRVEQSLSEYQAATRSNIRVWPAYLEPAEMLMDRGQPDDYMRAAELCRRGLDARPEDADFHACAARAWWAAGDWDKAAPHLDWLIQHTPQAALPHAGLAVVLLQQGRLDQAHEQAQQAIRLNPDAPEGHLALGMVLLRRGQPAPAREQFKFVLNSPTAPRWMKDQAGK